MHRLEFYFDCSSPWTYLAFERALAMFEGEVEFVWKPILVGGVFNTVNPGVYETRANPVPAKLDYSHKDLKDWADLAGVVIGQPPVFPVNSVKAMRGAFFALEQGALVPYARSVFKRYWTDLADISQEDELRAIVAGVGLDADAFFAAIATQPYKDKLREVTDELIGRGGFGSPTMYLDGDDMYFGNDRLELIRACLDRP
ncbi:MAG: 2-hydroxychromene-2-carboxylate isomerase [Gammaproteobacteria bacterium]|nr:2-hydroxychromene-2-carboxylate isomerase [Gammaproteobacteria bacterium]